MEYLRHPKRNIRHWISFPFIWSVLIPLVILDLVLEVYHRICFYLYRIPYVRRSQFIKIDRHRLRYLTVLQKLSCAYCGYANGLLNYAVMIAARTEEYWCGIKHEADGEFIPPAHQRNFLEYGDERGFQAIEDEDVAS